MVVENPKQYAITTYYAREFKKAYDLIKDNPVEVKDVDPLFVDAHMESYKSQYEELEEQLEEYRKTMTENQIVKVLVEEVMEWKCHSCNYGVAHVEYDDGHQATFTPFMDEYDFASLMTAIKDIDVPDKDGHLE